MEEYRLYIGGNWKEGIETKEIRSPYDQNPVAKIHFASKNQMEQAISSAHQAFEITKKLSSYDRSKVLEKISETIANKKEKLARSIVLTAGKTINSSRTEVSRAVSTFQIAAEEAKRMNGEIIPLDLSPETQKRWGLVRRFPIGTIAGITPFNFPLNLVAHKVAPAMAAGNTILVRPASQTSLTALLLGKIITEADEYACDMRNCRP